jgi:hypothetical protein
MKKLAHPEDEGRCVKSGGHGWWEDLMQVFRGTECGGIAPISVACARISLLQIVNDGHRRFHSHFD